MFMRRLFCSVLMLIVGITVYSQSIFSNPITGPNPNSSNPFVLGQIVDPHITVSGIGRGSGISGSNANERYAANGWSTLPVADEDDYFEFILTPNSGYEINLSGFAYTGQASGTGPVQFAFRSGVDGFTEDIGNPTATGNTIDLSAPSYQHITTAIHFRFYGWGGTGATGTFSINEFSFNGTVEPANGSTLPLVSLTSSFSAFNAIQGTPSEEQAYAVSGSNLTGDIILAAPGGFEISVSSETGYNSALVLSQNNGSVNTTVFVRLNSNNLGPASGFITHESPGIFSQQLAVSGNVLAVEPSVPSQVLFTGVTGNSFEINFSGGDGDKHLVLMKAGSAISTAPEDGTNYTANNVFGSGQAIGAGVFAVYSGSDEMVQVTGLSGNMIYHISVFEYNDDNVVGATNYFATAATGIQSTIASPEGLQLSIVNTIVTVDFDHTVDYVCNVQWNGSGFSSTPDAGQLNSGAWSVSGWTDGPLNYNETRTTGDYARGFTLTHPSSGGMYAFAPLAPTNRALGFQPGGLDWAPGTITLRVQNRTGVIMNTLGLAYKLFVYNDQNRSSSFNLSYSTDNSSFIPVAALDFNSPEAVEVSPVWAVHEKSIELSGLSLAPGQYIYLRWSSADVSGSGSRDEFALDDISVVANPIGPGPLPVRFTSIRAVQVQNGVEVHFSNLTEENLVSYIVERSEEGSRFTGIATLFPSANDGEVAKYSIIDPSPFKGNNFYRVRSVESNGNVSYSNIVRLNLKKLFPELTIYPNPLKGNEMGLQLGNLPPGRYRISIVNAAGQKEFSKELDHAGGAISEILTVSKLRPGWYSLQTNGAVHLQKQFIKE
jgi:hypothetical protein